MKIGRPRKLAKVEEPLLRLRMFISVQTQLISQREIADGYTLSIATVRRYSFPKEREFSQAAARKTYDIKRLEPRDVCECGVQVRGHARCQDCSILIHDVPPVCSCGGQHGRSSDGRRCENCASLRYQINI